ncbi:MAG: kelch repeat-containing protein [Myxococcota bacterium]
MNRSSKALCCLVFFAAACGTSHTGRETTPTPTEAVASTAETPTFVAEPDPEVHSLEGTSFLTVPPRSVTSFGAVVNDGKLYTLGGYFGEPHAYSEAGQSKAFHRISLRGDPRWEELPGLAQGIQGVTLATHDAHIYRAGGMRAHNAYGTDADMHSVAEVGRFNVGAGQWEELAPLPQARSSHDSIVNGDKLYVVGGWQLRGGAADAVWAESMYVLDLEGDSGWEEVSVPFQRRALAVASAGNSLLVLGGLDPERNVSTQVDVFDTEAGRWSRGPDFPGSGFGVAAIGVGSQVYASGGDGVIYRHELGSEAWEEVTTLTFPRFFHRMVHDDGRLIALGGIAGMTTDGRNRVVETVPIDGSIGEDRVSMVTIPNPSAAKNRQGIILHGDSLYLFGGNNSIEQHDFEEHNFVSSAHRLYIPAFRWFDVPAYPHARQTIQTWDSEARGFAVAGFGHDGTTARSHTEIYLFDYEAGAWQPRAQGLPEARTQFGLTEHDGKLWVFGGLNYDDTRERADHFRHLASVLHAPIDDPSAPFVDAGVALPAPRRAFGAAVLGDRYYIVGGMRENFQFVEDCIVYDFSTGDWSEMPPPAKVRLSGELVALDGKLYLAGGSIREGESVVAEPSIEVFDPETNGWSTLVEELPLNPRHMRMMAYHHRLLLYSAHDADAEVVRLAFVNVD